MKEEDMEFLKKCSKISKKLYKVIENVDIDEATSSLIGVHLQICMDKKDPMACAIEISKSLLYCVHLVSKQLREKTEGQSMCKKL